MREGASPADSPTPAGAPPPLRAAPSCWRSGRWTLPPLAIHPRRVLRCRARLKTEKTPPALRSVVALRVALYGPSSPPLVARAWGRFDAALFTPSPGLRACASIPPNRWGGSPPLVASGRWGDLRSLRAGALRLWHSGPVRPSITPPEPWPAPRAPFGNTRCSSGERPSLACVSHPAHGRCLQRVRAAREKKLPKAAQFGQKAPTSR